MSDQDGDEPKRRRLEGVIPELFKRAVEKGVETASSAPDNIKSFVGDMKLPKEIATYLFTQVDETKNGLLRVVAKEVRDFLGQTNIAGDIQKVLTTVQFEINTTIRFTPNDAPATPPTDDSAKKGGEKADAAAPAPLPKPEVKTDMYVKRDERRERRRRGSE